MESLSIELLGLLFLTGLLAGTLDSIAGGGGLIAFPVLLGTGISPLQALATNKLQGSFAHLRRCRFPWYFPGVEFVIRIHIQPATAGPNPGWFARRDRQRKPARFRSAGSIAALRGPKRLDTADLYFLLFAVFAVGMDTLPEIHHR